MNNNWKINIPLEPIVIIGGVVLSLNQNNASIFFWSILLAILI